MESRLIVTSVDNRIQFWNINDGTPLIQVEPQLFSTTLAHIYTNQHKEITSLCYDILQIGPSKRQKKFVIAGTSHGNLCGYQELSSVINEFPVFFLRLADFSAIDMEVATVVHNAPSKMNMSTLVKGLVSNQANKRGSVDGDHIGLHNTGTGTGADADNNLNLNHSNSRGHGHNQGHAHHQAAASVTPFSHQHHNHVDGASEGNTISSGGGGGSGSGSDRVAHVHYAADLPNDNHGNHGHGHGHGHGYGQHATHTSTPHASAAAAAASSTTSASHSADHAVLWMKVIEESSILLVAYFDGAVALWDLETLTRLHDLPLIGAGPTLMGMRNRDAHLKAHKSKLSRFKPLHDLSVESTGLLQGEGLLGLSINPHYQNKKGLQISAEDIAGINSQVPVESAAAALDRSVPASITIPPPQAKGGSGSKNTTPRHGTAAAASTTPAAAGVAPGPGSSPKAASSPSTAGRKSLSQLHIAIPGGSAGVGAGSGSRPASGTASQRQSILSKADDEEYYR
jgi:hypothetical protein